jgi:phosphatidate phosphatase APP1
MAELYQQWARAGAAFHYVSASPWQLYGPLADFRRQHRFPAGTFHLKTFRWKDAGLLNLFASPEETKRQAIEPLLDAFPRRRFVLVGDSGEKDPEIYGALARKYPRQVRRLFLRAVKGEDPSAERFQRAFEGLPKDTWQVFQNVEEIAALEPGLEGP